MLFRPFASVQGRLVSAFVLLVLMLSVAVVVRVWLADRQRLQLQEVATATKEANALSDARADALQIDAFVLYYLETGNASLVPSVRWAMADGAQQIAAARAADRAFGGAGTSNAATLEAISGTTTELTQTTEDVIAALAANDRAGAFDLLDAATPKVLQYWADLSAVAASARQDADAHQAEAAGSARLLFLVMATAGGLGVLLVLGIILSVILSVLRPLKRLQSAARSVSSGELNARADSGGPRELALVGQAFNEMTDRLLEKVTELQREIAIREKAEGLIRHLAYHDALTGLPSRLFFKERLDALLQAQPSSGGSLAVLFVDLDRFKVVNDTAGHLEGDRMLCNVAQRLRDAAQEGGIVARIGGDEFMILLTGLSRPSEAAVAAQRVVDSLRDPQQLGSHEFNITASVGIATYPGDERDAEALIRHADIAMYEAKSLGRDSYQFYTPEMNQSIIERLELENDLRHAIERGELEVYYQPLNAVGDRHIMGAEALLRWHHPQRGLIMPARFIPIAEETGLIVSIGEWMMRVACAQAKAWHDEGWPEFWVAVNLSARQFQQLGLTETIVRILRETGLPARSLQLEVTESTIIVELEYAVAVLNQLRALGVRVAIDDFGTGHSGLSYLHQLPVDVLKIDRSFVSNILANDREAEITTTVIALAHNLGLKVVAEGVENEEQFAFLQAHDCDKVQGYLFSEPVPAREFAALSRGEPEARAA